MYQSELAERLWLSRNERDLKIHAKMKLLNTKQVSRYGTQLNILNLCASLVQIGEYRKRCLIITVAYT